MSDIDLDAIIAQREEARAKEGATLISFVFDEETYDKTEGDTFTFTFKKTAYYVRDPRFLTDDEKDQLGEVNGDIDITCWYLGEEQFDKFLAAGGESWMFLKAFSEFQEQLKDEVQGNPTQRNRSSRRAAARKSSKRR